MAIYGVLGDIHGNLEALRAVLEDCEARGIERFLCVGDIVGFNADPNACARIVEQRGMLAIAGNHDLISLGRLGFGRCVNKVVYSLKRTRRAIDEHTARFLASLPAHRIVEQRVLLVHGGVRDVEQYVTTTPRVRENARLLRADFPDCSICLFGHTHEQKVYAIEGEDVRELPVDGPCTLRPDTLYFVNPGSVDPARRRVHKLAEYAVLDTDAWRLEFHRVICDHARSEAKATAAGYRIDPWTDRLYSVQRRLIGPRKRAD